MQLTAAVSITCEWRGTASVKEKVSVATKLEDVFSLDSVGLVEMVEKDTDPAPLADHV